MVGLLKYFSCMKPCQNEEDTDGKGKSNCLPDPNGELSKVVLVSSIEIISIVVCEVLEEKYPCGYLFQCRIEVSYWLKGY